MKPKKDAAEAMDNLLDFDDTNPVDLGVPSRAQTLLLAILGLHVLPTGRSIAAQIFGQAAKRMQLTARSDPKGVDALASQLGTAGLVAPGEHGLHALNGAGEDALDRLQADGDLEMLAEICESIRPVMELSTWGRNQYVVNSGSRLIRGLRAAILLRDDARLATLNKKCNRYYSDLHGQSPIHLAASGLATAARVARFTPTARSIVLLCGIDDTLLRLRPAPQVLEILDDPATMAFAQEYAELAGRQQLVMFARGKFADMDALLRHRGHEADMLRGLLALTRGDEATAMRYFTTATDVALQEMGRKKRGHFVVASWISILQLGLEVRDATPADYKWLAGCCRTLANESSGLGRAAQALEDLIAQLQGEATEVTGPYIDHRYGHMTGRFIDETMAAVVASWVGALETISMEYLATVAARADAAGLTVFADQIHAALGTLSSQYRHAATAARARAKAMGMSLWCDLIAPKPAWMSVLETITSLAGGAAAPAGGADGGDMRFVWCLHRHDDDWDDDPDIALTAMIQKRLKSGNWNKGRIAPVQAIMQGKATDILAALSDADQAIIGTCRKPRSRYNNKNEFLTTKKTWPALVGRDNVYLNEPTGAPLVITAMRPQVTHETSATGHRLRLDPPPPATGDVRLKWRGSRELQVWQYDGAMLQLAKLMGVDGLDIPEEGRQLLEGAMSAISHLVPVATESALAIGREVPADARPHLLLAPYEEGLRGQFRVRPLGPSGPCLRPAQSGSLSAACDGETLTTERDPERERRALHDLIRDCPTLDLVAAEDDDWILPDPQDCLSLLTELHPLTGESVVVEWPRGKPFSIRAEATAQNLGVTVQSQIDWFELDGKLRVDEHMVLDLADVLDRLTSSGSRFLPLGDGQYLALSQRFAQQLQHLSEVTKASKAGLLFHGLSAPTIEELLAACGTVKADKKWTSQTKKIREIWRWQPELPAGFQGELRDYQWEGFQWLARMARWGVGACLADEMGLGKTVQALATVLTRSEHGPTLVVAPTSVCENWIREAARFAPTLRCRLYSEAADRDALLADLGPGDVVACSFSLMALDADRLVDVKWQGLIVDEAQAIKNRETLRARSIARLKSHYRIATTGTPVENHLGELWSLFNVLNPGLLGEEKDFRLRYLNAVAATDPASLQRLRAIVRPFILRRTKGAVLKDLPPRTDILVTVRPEPEEVAFYEGLRRHAVDRLDHVEDRGPMVVLAELMRLRRACCHPRLIDPDTAIVGSKMEHAMELLEQLRENGQKCLVFSQFVGTLELMQERLDAAGITYQYLDGSTPAKQRQLRVDAFQKGEGDVFLISLKAGGTGLNLTRAEYVMHLDPWWNPAVEDQASDRAHRIGQTRPVTVYRLVVAGTIEEKIVKLHTRKRDLADAILAGADTTSALDAAALLALLREP